MKITFTNRLRTEYKVLQETVNSYIDKDKKKLINFSIFNTEECAGDNQWFIDCPDITSSEPVFEGDCSFTINCWRVSPSPVTSPTISNPTWKDIIIACNDLLQQGDECGIFLEAINKVEEGKYTFSIGS